MFRIIHVVLIFKVESDNKDLNEIIRSMEARERELEASLQEKVFKISRLEEELSHHQNKLDHMESVHRKERDAQNERVSKFILNFPTVSALLRSDRSFLF